MHPLIQRLKERKLVQWALAYLAGAAVLYQGLESFGEAWGVTASTFRIVQALLALGFVLTLVLAWYHGEQGRQRVSAPELLIIVGLLVVTGLLGTRLFAPEGAGGDGETSEPIGADRDPDAPIRPRVAVLPFVNMSGDPDNEYFSDGITEELINAIQQVPGVVVTARTSSFSFKGRDVPVVDVADALDVDYVLEGSVRRDEARVLIVGRLSDARTDTQLWSQRFARESDDMWDLQRDVATAIAGEFQVTLSGEQQTRLVANATDNLEAYEHYLRGRQLVYQRSAESILAGIRAFEAAMDADPSYAPAYAGLAQAYTMAGIFAAPPPDSSYVWAGRAIAYADRGIELDSMNAEAYLARAMAVTSVSTHLQAPIADLELVERHYLRALELRPSSADALGWYGQFLSLRGRHVEALELQERSIELDPIAPGRRVGYSASAVAARRYELAWQQNQRAIQLQPGIAGPVEFGRVGILLLLGRADECGTLDVSLTALEAMCLHEVGRVEEAEAMIDAVVVSAGLSNRAAHAEALVSYYAWTGQVQEALRWLERTLELVPATTTLFGLDGGQWDPVLDIDGELVRTEIERLVGKAYARVLRESRGVEFD